MDSNGRWWTDLTATRPGRPGITRSNHRDLLGYSDGDGRLWMVAAGGFEPPTKGL